MSTDKRLIVVMEGGCLMGVYSTDPDLIGLRYTTVDYDTEGLSDDDPIAAIRQDCGTVEEAYVRHHRVEEASIGAPPWHSDDEAWA
jgi:hypothetical protein